MNCPNCEFDIKNNKVCPSCGVDVYIYKKSCKISDVFFNRAINQAKAQDLSGAIENLNKSIEFNKNNIAARNVLGLVYFEMGALADALKQWIISASIIKDDNIALEYLERMQNSDKAYEKYNNAVIQYNQAVAHLKQKSDDMAIIALKKALELNPKLIPAMNLLTLCHLINKEKDKAEQMIEKVLAIDIKNEIALNYFYELNPRMVRPTSELPAVRKVAGPPQPVIPTSTVTQPLQPTYNRINTPPPKKSFGNSFHFAEILSFVFGALCAFAIFYILVLPGKIEAGEKEIETLKSTMTKNEKTYSDATKELQDTIDTLRSENLSLTSNVDNLNAQVKVQDQLKTIERVVAEKNNNKFEAAADILSTIDIESLSEANKEQVEKLRTEIMPKAAKALYNEGLLLYNQKQYDTARDKFEKSYRLADSADTVYYLGMTEKATSNVVKAKLYFQEILDKYPQSNQVNNAKARLRELQ